MPAKSFGLHIGQWTKSPGRLLPSPPQYFEESSREHAMILPSKQPIRNRGFQGMALPLRTSEHPRIDSIDTTFSAPMRNIRTQQALEPTSLSSRNYLPT
eukprot:gene10573-12232_t